MSGAVTTPSHLEMSDEDFLKAPMPVVTAPEPDTTDVVPEEVVPDATDEVDDEDAPDDKEVPAAETDPDEVKGPVEGDKTKTDEAPDVDTIKPAEKQVDVVDPKAEKPAPVIDFEAEYKKVLAPFNANGREIQVHSIDDAMALMKMGANYNKKMAGLKPSMKILKLLENNGLLDEGKLNFLIDLDKRDPQAINKLVKESGLNPMDLDAEKAGDYTPKTRSVDEREIELDTVLDEIQDTPTYTQTLNVVSKKWDGPSKNIVAAQPQLLKVINDHMSSGIYDLISAGVESERMLGRLNGLSDIEAYRKVGDDIQARGGFNHLGSSQGKSVDVAPKVVVPKPKVDEEALKEKRRAAASTPAAAPSAPAKEFNPLGMSDEDFSKAAAPRFQ